MSTSLIRWMTCAALIAIALASPARASADEAAVCDPEKQKVEVDANSTGWTVTRVACDGEKSAALSVTFNGQTFVVAGVSSGKLWTFELKQTVPNDAIVALEFKVGIAAEPAKAQAAGRVFLEKLRIELLASFDEAVRITRDAPGDARAKALINEFNGQARERVGKLVVSESVPFYTASGEPLVNAILAAAGFRKVAPGEWEPTENTLETLKRFSLPAVNELAIASGLLAIEPSKLPLCTAKLPQTPSQAEREAALMACVKEAVAAAEAGNVAATTFSSLKQLSVTETASVIVNVPSVELTVKPGTSNSLLANPYRNELTKTRLALTPALVARFDEAQLGIRYVAAHIAREELKPKLDALMATVFLDAANKALVEITFTRKDQASQLVKVKVTAGKPRFFVSTGVAVTSLNSDIFSDPNKISIPVLVSVCLSPQGCETKGIGSGGKDLNYLSVDVGVNAIFIGTKNPRQGTPSFLFGVGVTPVYATHFSLGVNLFENPQTSRANVGAYLAVTIDTVDGAGILGALGLGKPDVEVISGGKTSEGANP